MTSSVQQHHSHMPHLVELIAGCLLKVKWSRNVSKRRENLREWFHPFLRRGVGVGGRREGGIGELD